MTSRIRASQPSICFGYKTALQIARATRPGELSPMKGKSFALPDRVPRVDELRMALDRLEATHPSLQIDRPAHVLIGSTRYSARGVCKPHACTVSLSGSSFLRGADGLCVARPELALVQEAAQLNSEIELLELIWELCGSYRTRRTSSLPAYDVSPLTEVKRVRDFVARNPSLCGARKLARILPYVADQSASPRETKLALVLGLPMKRGGYGLGIPRMNFEVIAGKEARAISGRKSLRCDLCWPEVKLDVEYQSREHHEGERSRISDSRRANALATMGWTVIGVTNDELDSLVATDAIDVAIRRHLGKRQQTRVSDLHARKLKLRRQLGLPVGYD